LTLQPTQTWESAIGDMADGGRVTAQTVLDRGRTLLRYDGEDRREKANAALVLYHCNNFYSFSAGVPNLFGGFDGTDPVGFNVIRSCVDTKLNHVVRNKVRPLFVTERGDSKLKEKALGMQRAVEGVFKTARIYGDIGTQVCRHGYLFSGGGVQISPDYANHTVDVDLVRAHEFLVDPNEADRGDPRQAWRVRYVPRDVLMKRFGSDDKDAAAAIAGATANDSQVYKVPGDANTVADMIEVWEYWHLPSGYVSDDESEDDGEEVDEQPEPDGERDRKSVDGRGRHIICIENHVLLDEEWKHNYFPVAWFKPYRAATGWWSVGLPERLAPQQLKLNEYNKRIDQIIKMHAVPKMIVDRRAKIKVAKFTNDVANIFETSANPTTSVYYLTPQSVPAELFRRVEDIIRWCREETGISEMSMYARKPSGVDHAPGMQMLADTETIRHTVDFRAWEQFHIDAAMMVVDALRLLAENDPDYQLFFADSKQLRRIKWKDVDLDNEKFHLTVWPTNMLPQTPAAKLSTAMEMYNAQLWSKDQTLLVLDYPDTEAVTGDLTAALENIERMIDDAKAGKNPVPTPYMNLGLMMTTVVNAINRAEADREPDAQVQPLRDLWESANTLAKRMQAEQMAAEQAAMAAAQPPVPPPAPMPPQVQAPMAPAA
jgi:hypothetical protein